MANVTIAPSTAGSVALSGADHLFWVEQGIVSFSTDGGTTYIPFRQGEKVAFSDGLTVHYQGAEGNRGLETKFRHMAM